MTDTLPDRLSLDPRSPHYNADILQQGIGVKINGVEKTNVFEYCISEGWIRVVAGKSLDRKGLPMMLTHKGKIEVWIKGEG